MNRTTSRSSPSERPPASHCRGSSIPAALSQRQRRTCLAVHGGAWCSTRWQWCGSCSKPHVPAVPATTSRSSSDLFITTPPVGTLEVVVLHCHSHGGILVFLPSDGCGQRSSPCGACSMLHDSFLNKFIYSLRKTRMEVVSWSSSSSRNSSTS